MLQGTVNGAAGAGANGLVVKRAGEMALVEKSQDFVTLLEAGYARADFLDDTGSVRGRYDTSAEGEWVETLDDRKVTVVERCGMDCQLLLADERVMAVVIDYI